MDLYKRWRARCVGFNNYVFWITVTSCNGTRLEAERAARDKLGSKYKFTVRPLLKSKIVA